MAADPRTDEEQERAAFSEGRTMYDPNPAAGMDERYAEAYAPSGVTFAEDLVMPALEDFL